MAALSNIGLNLVANLLFWLGTGVLVLGYVRLRQGGFLSFFGLHKEKTLKVYLSNLHEDLTIYPENEEGRAISPHEFKATDSIRNLFGSTPFSVPQIVQGLVDGFWVGGNLRIDSEVPLPSQEVGLPPSSMIVLGSSTRNTIRRYYVDQVLPSREASYLMMKMHDEPHPKVHEQSYRCSVRTMKRGQKTSEPEIWDDEHNLAIIQKLHEDDGIMVFMCLGERGDSTWAATEYVVKNWPELRRAFGDSSFALCLGFPWLRSYMMEYNKPSVLKSIPPSNLR